MSRLGKRTTTIADAKTQLLLVLKKFKKKKSRSWKDCFVPPTDDHDCMAVSKFLEIFVKKKRKRGKSTTDESPLPR